LTDRFQSVFSIPKPAFTLEAALACDPE
jgi:hypothetical protein